MVTVELVERALGGDRRSLGRLITLVENSTPQGREALRLLHPHTGRAQVIGITGPPGAGKSTLVSALALEVRRRGKSLGIIAVDPSSPMTGGAVLGDRVRMQELWNDPGVFIRSMASRGALGGLAETTGEVVSVMDAAGKDVVMVETVGVGQGEVEIARAAHTTIVVGVPGLGDEVQAMKAGVLEIADIYVVNKADKDGADRLVSELNMIYDLGPQTARRVPILKTVAVKNEGISELADAIEEHWRYLQDTGKLESENIERARREVLSIAREELLHSLLGNGSVRDELNRLVKEVAGRIVDPYTAAETLLRSKHKQEVLARV